MDKPNKSPYHLQIGTTIRSERRTTNLVKGSAAPKTMFKCPECPYIALNNSVLNIHYRIHTGEKPYSCSHCAYRTHTISNLNKHIRLHTGEKPFKCPHCPFQASDKSNLNRHKLTHQTL